MLCGDVVRKDIGSEEACQKPNKKWRNLKQEKGSHPKLVIISFSIIEAR